MLKNKNLKFFNKKRKCQKLKKTQNTIKYLKNRKDYLEKMRKN